MRITKNFQLSEFHCKDKNRTPVPYEFLINVFRLATMLQVLRDWIGRAVIVNSGYRTLAHNLEVEGSPTSYHLRALGADIHIEDMSSTQLAHILKSLQEKRLLKYTELLVYPGHVHVAIEELT